MANKPTIKVDADLSTVDAEITRLKQTIGQLGDQLKTESGKTDFNFKGAQKELDALIARADKLTEALGKTGKTSGQYAKNLKDAQAAMEAAAKLSARLEAAGGSRSSRTSGYFRNYAAELAEESAETTRRNAEERERSARESRAASESQARTSRWAGHAGRIAGAVGGAVMGGGGTYANLGGMVGSAFGPIGGMVGGMVGGTADRFMSPSREEAKTYSELRRMVGSTTADFGQLRDSMRSVVHGMGVTDNEAANLAKQFAHTASLTGDATDTIARSMGTSTGFAQSYGMAPNQATAFFAQMRLTGGANNDKDNRRLAMLIGESVQRGGTSAKMDEVLSAVSNFATRSAQQMLTAPNVGQYSSYLASLTGSSYAGLKGDPNNASQLMAMMDAGVANGGTMGEASQYQWLRARQSAFPGMSAMDNSLMQTAGTMGDLTKLFAPGSPAYDRAVANKDFDTVARYDNTRQSIDASGFRNNFQAVMPYIKAISGGDSSLENANFRGFFGGNVQQAAVLMQRFGGDEGLGGLEKELSRYGIGLDNVNVSQIASFSQLLGGGEKAMSAQYEKLLGSGKLSKAELDRADATMAKDGYGEEFKKLLLNLTAKYDADDGLKSQTSMIDISNKIQAGVSNLVSIETDVREYILALLRHADSNNPVIKRIQDRELTIAKEGIPSSGKDFFGGRAYRSGEVDEVLLQMRQSSSPDERARLAQALHTKIKRNKRGYPAESVQWLNQGLATGDDRQSVDLPDDASQPTVPASVAPTKRDLAEVAPDTRPAAVQQNPVDDDDRPSVPAKRDLTEMAPDTRPADSQRKTIDDGSRHIVPAEVALSKRQRDIISLTRSPSKYDPLFANVGKMVGVDPLLIKQIAAQESGLNPDATSRNRNGTMDLGMMQHNSRYAGERGINGKNWQDPYQNTLAGGKYFKQLLNRYDGDVHKAMKHYNGSGPAAEQYADMAMGAYNSLHADQMPEAQRRTPEQEREKHFSSKHEITLYDRERNLMADPVTVSTRFGAPMPAGGN